MHFLVPDVCDEDLFEGEIGEVGDDGVDPGLLELDCAAGLGPLDLGLVEGDLGGGDRPFAAGPEVCDPSEEEGSDGGVEDNPVFPEDVGELLMDFDSDDDVGFGNLLDGVRDPFDVHYSSEEDG